MGPGREVTTSGTDEAAQRADAIKIASMKPFAVLASSTSLNQDTMVAELAARKILVCCYTAITLLEQVRKRFTVRRDYESLYALGVAFTAYAAAEAVGGSGFLAAFAAATLPLSVWMFARAIRYAQRSGSLAQY